MLKNKRKTPTRGEVRQRRQNVKRRKLTKKQKTESQKPKAESRLTTQVLSFTRKSSRITLPKEVFKVEVAPATLAQAVRVYLINQRKGTVKTKARGEVRGGGRKPWRQKGTGRARAGSIRAPNFRGGGVVFGPKEREFLAKLPKKVRPKALAGAISAKFAAGDLKIVDNFERIKPQTRELVKALERLKIPSEKILWVVDGTAQNLVRAGQNLPNLSFARVENLTTYQVMAAKILVLNKNTIERLKERIS